MCNGDTKDVKYCMSSLEDAINATLGQDSLYAFLCMTKHALLQVFHLGNKSTTDKIVAYKFEINQIIKMS